MHLSVRLQNALANPNTIYYLEKLVENFLICLYRRGNCCLMGVEGTWKNWEISD